MGRLDAIREGWTSSSTEQNKRDESNDSAGFQASKIWMRFLYLPVCIFYKFKSDGLLHQKILQIIR